MPQHPPAEFVRTFTFSVSVPRGRAYYFAEDGTLVFNMRTSEMMPPLPAWASCVFSVEDASWLSHRVEVEVCG